MSVRVKLAIACVCVNMFVRVLIDSIQPEPVASVGLEPAPRHSEPIVSQTLLRPSKAPTPMTQASPYAPYDAYAAVPQRTNTIGLSGYECSLLGLLTGGHLLSPVGLILSLIGLGQRPRGWAVAGVIIGLLGTCGWLIVAVLVAVAIAGVLLAGVGMFFFTQADRIELTTDMSKIAMQAEDYKHNNRGVAPADLTVLNLQTPALTDPWGTAYHYELTDQDPGYDIVSDGPDGKPGTADDVYLSKIDKYWEDAGKDFERQMKEFQQRSKDGRGMTIKIGPEKDGARITVDEDRDGDADTDADAPTTRPNS